MSDGWLKSYTELKDFIYGHPEIKIESSHVHLPGTVRTEFYQRFNDLREVFIEEKFSALLSEAQSLSQNYLKVEQEITEILKLDCVSMEPRLQRFLYDPIDQLTRELFDSLFDLLKENINIETFEETTSQNIKASFETLYRLGYGKWVALSLVKLLKADKLLQVTLPKLPLYDAHKKGGLIKEDVPSPEGSKVLSFKYAPYVICTIPDLIIYSTKLNKYLATRSQISKSYGITTNASKKREWYPLDYITTLESGLTIVYVGDSPEEISIVADVNKICKPDMIIECKVQQGWYEKEGLEKIELYHNNLKPRLGTYIVSKESIPEQARKELMPEQCQLQLGEGINLLTVCFAQSKLKPIINTLAK